MHRHDSEVRTKGNIGEILMTIIETVLVDD